MKRTTGIPRSFLQKVDKSVILAQTDGDEAKRPSGIMVNADGDFVIAEPDKASWEQYQAKTKSSTANKEAQAEDKEVEERGLQCSIDKKMLVEPMKAPCCQKTFCNDCITNALIESDFVCPACQEEGVLIDDLQADDEASKKIQEYLKDKETAKSPPANSPPAIQVDSVNDLETSTDVKADEVDDAQEKQEDPEVSSNTSQSATIKSPMTEMAKAKSPTASPTISETAQAAQISDALVPTSKKRAAEDALENTRIPKGPKAMQTHPTGNSGTANPILNGNMNSMNGMMNGMPDMGGMNSMMFNGMGMPNMMSMPGMNMGMGMPMMGMPMMGMPGFGNMNGGFGGMNGGMNGGWDMSGMGAMNGMQGMQSMQSNMGMGSHMGMAGNMGMGASMTNMNGGMNGFQQNVAAFGQVGSQGGGGGDDEAYFRKPVNPHRHQNKQRRVRPSDYREL